MTASAERPAVVTISGVEVVTIPLAHYAELLDCQRQLAAARLPPERFRADARSRIDRDPEVATFLTECLGRMLLKDAVAACRERFGVNRFPPQSTVQRYWARLREVSGQSARGRNHLG
ncbi:MAG TPA: hypothetical protein VH414_03870 [Lichenihabitans sp.]|jgi:hypothetical protein|nr:hypothetical protein [Lichenihabitans sp.]